MQSAPTVLGEEDHKAVVKGFRKKMKKKNPDGTENGDRFIVLVSNALRDDVLNHVKKAGSFLILPLIPFDVNSDSLHNCIESTPLDEQFRALAESFQILLVHHDLVPNFIQLRQIGMIDEPAYRIKIAEAIHINTHLQTIFLV